MSFVTSEQQKNSYDVIVVGSGAGGGQSAYTLCMAGARVLMLEAGRNYRRRTETPMFQTPELAPLARRRHAARSRSASTTRPSMGAGRCPASRTSPRPQDPAGRFDWWRARMLGGRTNHWGRISLRNGPYDFKPVSRDGSGLRLADRL